MPTEFHRRVRKILERTIQLPPEEREECLRQACAGNPELLEEVRSLLPHYEVMRDFEPQRPRGSAWNLPGTTTFTEAKATAEDGHRNEAERLPPFTIDRYTVLEVLGRGGMGVVYRAVHPTLHRQVALKILRKGLLSQENRQRFTFEEEVLRQLQHPGIARFVHAGIARIMPIEAPTDMSDWRPYFVMEYVAGRSLIKYATANELDVRQRLTLFVKIGRAAEYAHHRGIIHRDLKPDNILVPSTGEPKILDFGIAHIPAFQSNLVRDKDGHFTGTLQYASPEQIAGKIGELTPASDVYTLGLILHELLTGRLPKRTRSGLKLTLGGVRLDENHGQPGPRDEEFLYYLTAILATALRQTEGEHYRTAGEMATDIDDLLASFPVLSQWSLLKARLARVFFAPLAKPEPAATRRPLRAVLRKRIAMAVESGVFRAAMEAGAHEPPDGPEPKPKPEPPNPDSTIRLKPNEPHEPS